MKLNESQIAHLFLAFHDGTISAAEKALLDQLLLEFPEYTQDLELFALAAPEIDNALASNLMRSAFEKLLIYQDEDGHPYDKLAIGSLEGLLNAEELLLESSLQQDKFYIENKQKYDRTILAPDTHIVYPKINDLIKNAPIRRFSFKKLAYTTSSAAAILIAAFLIYRSPVQPSIQNHNQPNPATNKQIPTQLAAPLKQHTPISNKKLIHQAVFHPTYIGNPDAKDCIAVFPEPTESAQQFAQLAIENMPSQPLSNTPTNPNQDKYIGINTDQSPSRAFAKEPITMKAFLLQKTNERLFGTAAPSPDLRYETMARYASQTIGLPVKYEVEEGFSQDKVIFQLGPLSFERNRAKK